MSSTSWTGFIPRRSAFDWRVAYAFGGVDLLLIAFHAGIGLALTAGAIETWPRLLHIGRDWSLAEMLNYGKWGFLGAGLLLLGAKRAQPLLLALGTFFLLLLADDSLQIHERGGSALAISFGLHLAVGAIAFAVGEIVTWAAMGLSGLLLVRLGWQGADTPTRTRVKPLLVLFVPVILCGVGFDLIHVLAPDRILTEGVLGILEDGGEMLAITALVSYAAGSIWRRDPQVPLRP